MVLNFTTSRIAGVIVVYLSGAILFGESASLLILVKDLLKKSHQIVLDLGNVTLCIPKTPSSGFPSNVTLLLPGRLLTEAQVPFLHVIDSNGIRRGWVLRDTQSEFPAVVIPVATQHYMLLQRNLIYTGITRGKKLVVLIGQKKALAIAVHNDRPQRRYSGLLASLRGNGQQG